MIKNYLKMAFRNVVRHPGYSALNIIGLAIGFAVCFLIALFVWDEYQYDTFLPNKERIYRVYNHKISDNSEENLAVTPPMYATTLHDEFPEVETTARVLMTSEEKRLFQVNGKKIYNEYGLIADSTFFDIFNLKFIAGSPKEALEQRTSIVLSKEFALNLFGSTDIVGKDLTMQQAPLTITGVFEKDPKFHLQFDYMMPLSLANLPEDRMQSWGWQQFFTYVKLKSNTDAVALQSKFDEFIQPKFKIFDPNYSGGTTPILQPLKEIYLYSSDFKFNYSQSGNITYVRALSYIALFILLIACFNFVNLATAKSLQRAKEVGVRKSIGANKRQLLFQFVIETLLLTVIALFCALILSATLLPWLNSFTGKNIPFSILAAPQSLLALSFITLLVGFLAGIYPAIVISNFNPVKALKGSADAQSESVRTPILRHSLVVVQFTLSVLLIISALVVFNQVDYLHNKDLGFNKEQIMFFPMRGKQMFDNQEGFKSQLEQVSGVKSVSIGYGFPGDAVAGDGIKVKENGQLVDYPATQLMVDYDYIETLGLELIAGRGFSQKMRTDKDHAYIINQTAVKNLGFKSPENAVGQMLYWRDWNAKDPDSLKEGAIIGVVKDFNYKSLYDKVETAVLQIYPSAAWKVAVKLETSEAKNALTQINSVWDKFSAEYPLEYKFLDDNFERMYMAEDKLKTLLGVFTLLAIFIGCLGLFGLAAFSAERRKREIGIRKVLGASVENIVLLLTGNFVKLVLISLFLATPLAWYFMSSWLQNFAYRISLSWWLFIVAGAVALFVAVLTVSYHAIKAAVKNPISNINVQ